MKQIKPFMFNLFLGMLIFLVASCKKDDPQEIVDSINGVKFSEEIAPLLSNRCGECHSAGASQTNYLDYTTARNGIDRILNRIQREEGSAGFMPLNGTKLSQESIDLIQQWRDDGFLN